MGGRWCCESCCEKETPPSLAAAALGMALGVAFRLGDGGVPPPPPLLLALVAAGRTGAGERRGVLPGLLSAKTLPRTERPPSGVEGASLLRALAAALTPERCALGLRGPRLPNELAALYHADLALGWASGALACLRTSRLLTGSMTSKRALSFSVSVILASMRSCRGKRRERKKEGAVVS